MEKKEMMLNEDEKVVVKLYSDDELAQMSHEDLENLVKERTAQLEKQDGRIDIAIQTLEELKRKYDEGVKNGDALFARCQKAESDVEFYKRMYKKEQAKIDALKGMMQTWEY